MSSENGHGHSHDSHYHGEPSRTLDDQPLPPTVFLYKSGLVQESEKDVNDWIDQLEGIEEIKAVLGGIGDDVESSELEIIKIPEDQTNLFNENFDGLPNSINESESVLFLPENLHVESSTWKDLRANDITVNWLSVDTNPETDYDLPRLVVLSDWVTSVSLDIPEGRSTGITPGIFHLTNESLDPFEDICFKVDEFQQAFETFLDDPSRKIRPGFLHEREWTFN